MISETPYVFFGTGALAESALAALVNAGYIPKMIVTKPDSPQGRHMQLVAPYIKTWAEMKGIPVLQPEKLNEETRKTLQSTGCQLFIVASYGKIIPKDILDIPTHGTLNVHPSLLPKYRGASPIESALLSGDMTTGVTIIKLDEEMDHGPIISQNAFMIDAEATAGTMEVKCGQIGGEMLVQVLPHYLDGSLIPKEQDHSLVTHCSKIKKEDGLITLDDDITLVRRKYRAFTPWPGLYFFITHKDKEVRVKVGGLDLVSEKDSKKVSEYITSVIPEGKAKMDFESFRRGYLDSH